MPNDTRTPCSSNSNSGTIGTMVVLSVDVDMPDDRRWLSACRSLYSIEQPFVVCLGETRSDLCAAIDCQIIYGTWFNYFHFRNGKWSGHLRDDVLRGDYWRRIIGGNCYSCSLRKGAESGRRGTGIYNSKTCLFKLGVLIDAGRKMQSQRR